MIQVTKILEGGIDLSSGEGLPRCLVVSNGHREVHIPVSDAVVKEVATLFVELSSVAPKGTTSNVTDLPRPKKAKAVEMEEVIPSSDTKDDEFSPGADYNDTGTGVSSL